MAPRFAQMAKVANVLERSRVVSVLQETLAILYARLEQVKSFLGKVDNEFDSRGFVNKLEELKT